LASLDNKDGGKAARSRVPAVPLEVSLIQSLRRAIALCYGTRPQIVKASVLLEALRRCWPVVSIDTGQHYDFELNELLYRQLAIPEPDHFLEVGSSTPVQQTADVMLRTAEILRATRPAAVLVIGDTNSTLGCALAASKEDIPVVHVEAGLRAVEPNLPEEVNRRVVDALARLLCAPCDAAAARLRAEQAPGEIRVTGDVARDVLLRHLPLAPAANGSGPFILATAHRAALTSDRFALESLRAGLGSTGLPVRLPLHPRTRAALERFGLMECTRSSIRLESPLGYLELLGAVRDADVVVTDSGGVQREAFWLGTPCITVRGETEWQETVACGANTLLPADQCRELLPELVARCRRRGGPGTWDRTAYGDGNAASRVAHAVRGFLD
jgi:UDP-N-acetylglucosamine 2-epimerase